MCLQIITQWVSPVPSTSIDKDVRDSRGRQSHHKCPMAIIMTRSVHCLTLSRGGGADSDFKQQKREQTKRYSRANTKVAQT